MSSTQKHAAKAAKAEARRRDQKLVEIAALVSKNKNVRQQGCCRAKQKKRVVVNKPEAKKAAAITAAQCRNRSSGPKGSC